MRREDGQTAAEYMGMLLVLAAIVVVAVPGLRPSVTADFGHLIRCIGGGGCSAAAGGGSGPGPLGAAEPAATPAPTTVTQPSGLPAGAAAAWSGQAANLPRGGSRPYVPPKNSHGQPKKVPAGRRGGAKGYEDADGNIWVWNPPGSPTAHGGPHWDVEHKDGSHTNVNPDGSIRGEDNFPNKPRGNDDSGGSSDNKDNTSKIVGGAAAGVGAGAIIWWGAKVLSPACGPLLPVCAIGL
jgi:Flp pilus assembly pilin Flp